MPHGITQCYLPAGSGENPALTPLRPKQVLDLATVEGCKAELTYVTWKRTGRGIEPATCKLQVLRHTAKLPRNTKISYIGDKVLEEDLVPPG